MQPRAPEADSETLGAEPRKIAGLRLRDLGIRFAFGFAVSAVAGIIGVAVGIRAGGVLLAFPAILPAALTLIESREGTSQAVSDVRGAVAGALAMIGFAAVVILLGSRLPLGLTLVVALAAWCVLAAGVYWGGAAAAHLLHEQQYLPDVAVIEAQPFVQRLRRRGLTLAVAESFTGGALAALFAQTPGASTFFRGGVIAYQTEVKKALLGVHSGIAEHDAAVTEDAAKALARGVRAALSADVGVALTGAGGSSVAGKRAGLAFAAISDGRRDDCIRVQRDGMPERITADAIRAALRLDVDVQ